MSENPSEHNNDEERLPKTRSQLGGGNWIPPILVTAPESGDDDDFQKACLEYVALCVECNRRLLKIAPLLKRGLRNEAIALAFIEPDLLELVENLDFPERDQFASLCETLNLEPPPTLRLDIASQLNEAIYKVQPTTLARLLRLHRLLALAGAPLSQRIATLRNLIDADPETLVWQEDLKILEQALDNEEDE